MNVLINTPFLKLPGGVSNHYSGLSPFWRFDVKYNSVGGRHGIPGPIILLFDFVKFLLLCASRRYQVVVLNPSLGINAINRDSFFLFLAKIFSLRVVVFFHGWDAAQEKRIDSKPESFARRFSKADAFIVLSSEFRTKLHSWGVVSPVYLATTKVDDRLLDDIDIRNKYFSKTVLFLARLEENKGIFQSVDAFSRVLDRHPDARFIVAGSGGAMGSAVEMVRLKSIPNVEFLGNVSGDALIRAFYDANVYILPTTHGEGMPTSVLEAMAFGLPIITRPVGGLRDFFEDGRMGFISDSLDPQWYAEILDRLFSDPDLLKKIGQYNHSYAKEHFLASKVARRLEEIVASVL